MSFETLSVIGLGYIGLPTAAMFAAYGKNVIGVDVNQETVDTINRGEIHIVEPELAAIVYKAVTEGKLRAVIEPEVADAFLIAVPTPFLPIENEGDVPQPDLKYIKAAAKAIAPVLKKGDLVVLESTSPVGTTESMSAWLAESRPDLSFPQQEGSNADVSVAHCPERVLPGNVIRELVGNDRVVGGMTERCSEYCVELYKTFVKGECVATTVRMAEMAKLTENAFRDVNIAFANELSIICDKLNINVWELIDLANRHPRVNILQPGPGVGGHCIAVDPWFIVHSAPDQAKLIRASREVNDSKPDWVVEKVKIACFEVMQKNVDITTSSLKIACLGLSFKADIDDLRQSPALTIAKELHMQQFAELLLVEPNIDVLPEGFNPKTAKLVGMFDAIANASVIVVLVDHKEFKEIDLAYIGDKVVLDTRGIWI